MRGRSRYRLPYTTLGARACRAHAEAEQKRRPRRPRSRSGSRCSRGRRFDRDPRRCWDSSRPRYWRRQRLEPAPATRCSASTPARAAPARRGYPNSRPATARSAASPSLSGAVAALDGLGRPLACPRRRPRPDRRVVTTHEAIGLAASYVLPAAVVAVALPEPAGPVACHGELTSDTPDTSPCRRREQPSHPVTSVPDRAHGSYRPSRARAPDDGDAPTGCAARPRAGSRGRAQGRRHRLTTALVARTRSSRGTPPPRRTLR